MGLLIRIVLVIFHKVLEKMKIQSIVDRDCSVIETLPAKKPSVATDARAKGTAKYVRFETFDGISIGADLDSSSSLPRGMYRDCFFLNQVVKEAITSDSDLRGQQRKDEIRVI